jgi:hypothetical protein
MTFGEWRRVLVRVAYDRYVWVRGVDNRLRALLREEKGLAAHWCLTIDHGVIDEHYGGKEVQGMFDMHKSTLKKIAMVRSHCIGCPCSSDSLTVSRREHGARPCARTRRCQEQRSHPRKRRSPRSGA